MGYTEVATNDAMPSGSVLLVELLLDMLGHVLLYTVLLERLSTPHPRKQRKENPPISFRIAEHRTPCPNKRHPLE